MPKDCVITSEVEDLIRELFEFDSQSRKHCREIALNKWFSMELNDTTRRPVPPLNENSLNFV